MENEYENLVAAISHIDAALHRLGQPSEDEHELCFELNEIRNVLNDDRLEILRRTLGSDDVAFVSDYPPLSE